MGGLRDNLYRRASLEQRFEMELEELRKRGGSILGGERLVQDLIFTTQRWLEEQAAAHRIWKNTEAVDALYEAISWRLRKKKPKDQEDPSSVRIRARMAVRAERRLRSPKPQ